MAIDFCVLLTCTIDVRGIAFMQRSNIEERLNDYTHAFRHWLNNDNVKNIVFIENSGHDLRSFQEMAHNFPEKKVELISFDGQDFDRNLGKGYGEMLALKKALHESEILRVTKRFIKVNGRYHVPQIRQVANVWQDAPDVISDFSKNLTWSDSRIFGGTREFLDLFLLPELIKVDDSAGTYFEHALARATHIAIAKGLRWALCPPVPIIGVSGTENKPYKRSKSKEILKFELYKIKKLLLAR